MFLYVDLFVYNTLYHIQPVHHNIILSFRLDSVVTGSLLRDLEEE